MKDIKLALPREVWRVRGRPLDLIKLDLITLFGSIGVVSQLLGPRRHLAVFPLLVLIVRTYLGHRRTRVYHASVTSSMLFDRCLDKDRALARQLPRAAEEQVFSECVLAYWALVTTAARSCRGAWLPEARLERSARSAARALLSEAGLPTAGVQPRLHAALQRLEAWGLVAEEPASIAEGGQSEGQNGGSGGGEARSPAADTPAALEPHRRDAGVADAASQRAVVTEEREQQQQQEQQSQPQPQPRPRPQPGAVPRRG